MELDVQDCLYSAGVCVLSKIARLRSELDIVRGNCKVMSEMLTEMVPGQEDASDLELLQVLNLSEFSSCFFFNLFSKRACSIICMYHKIFFSRNDSPECTTRGSRSTVCIRNQTF